MTNFNHSFLVFPQDLNSTGTLFGGKVLAEMDIAAAMTARRALIGGNHDGIVTAHISSVDFKNPAGLNDLILLEGIVTSVGTTSLKISVNVVKEDSKGTKTLICCGNFVFVAMKDKKPYPHRFGGDS